MPKADRSTLLYGTCRSAHSCSEHPLRCPIHIIFARLALAAMHVIKYLSIALLSISGLATALPCNDQPLLDVLSDNKESGLIQSGSNNGYHASGTNAGKNANKNNTGSGEGQSASNADAQSTSSSNEDKHEALISILSSNEESGK